jgi:chemotaxis protein MotA
VKIVVEGFEPGAIRELMETEIHLIFEREESAARVFEGAGRYAPTIGILGAVIGLIRVITMHSDPSKIGEGAATAIVAIIYGLGLANLLLLPWANKLKHNAKLKMLSYEIVKIGVIGILEGVNPNFLKEKLDLYINSD